MPNTPKVNFNFSNENVEISVPQNGISHFCARTTKGKFNDPSVLISSFIQFQRLFGEEIVPDGSESNIKKALALGSKLRIARVAGGSASYGYLIGSDDAVKEFTITFTSPTNDVKSLVFKVRSIEQGTPFMDVYTSIYGKFDVDTTSGPNARIVFTQYAESTHTTVLDKRSILQWNVTKHITDFQSMVNFLNQCPNITLEVVTFDGETNYDIYGVLTWLSENPEYIPSMVADPNYYEIESGSDGGDSTTDTWLEAYNSLKDYVDGYNLVLSHVHQHLTSSATDVTTVYQTVAEDVVAGKEIKLMVEVPKPTEGQTTSQYFAALKNMVNAVGQDPMICYFGGGIKYYNNLGILRDCDVMGTVIGLHDSCASKYGPWYSPAGQNRGIVTDAVGPVMENLGVPSQMDTLQEFAEWYMNLFVVKDTRYAGKRTMLWHNFTSNPLNNSEKFISIVNLNLYLKKQLRPILESFLEEPNTFETWKNIYYSVKPLLDDLIVRNAMTEYQWLGDQDATSYAELSVNTESEVRQGYYKVKLIYKDIVTLQDITLDVIISSSENVVTIEPEY